MGEGPTRLLIVPALFDEGNRMRRLTVEVMRRLAASGIASVLPDLPGLQESTFLWSGPTLVCGAGFGRIGYGNGHPAGAGAARGR
jgi:hypothetical protein